MDYNFIQQIRGSVSSGIAQRIKSGMLWSFTGTAIAKFLILLSGIACARILSKELYGEFNMVRSTINMFVVLGTGGLGVTATKYISEYKKSQKEKIPNIYALTSSFSIFIGLICTVLIVCASGYISAVILKEPSINTAIKLGGLLLFFTCINGVQNGTLAGFEKFKDISINSFIGSIFECIFMLIGAYYYQVEGAIVGFGMGFIALYVANKISINHTFRQYQLSFRKGLFPYIDWSILLHYSLPAALSSILITPTFWMIRTILVRHGSFSELAVFEAADQWKVIILYIPTAISQISLPILSSLLKEKKDYFNTLKLNLVIVSGITFLLVVIVCCLGSYIMGLYGKGYNNSLCLQIISISTLFSAIANIIELSIYSVGKMWQCFVINSFWAISMIGFAELFVNIGMGATGLSLSILISYVISCVLFYLYLLKIRRNEF